jgi:hypothetical protein
MLINLKMEAACSSQTLVSTYKSTQCHSPGDHYLNKHRRKTYNMLASFWRGYHFKWQENPTKLSSNGFKQQKYFM